MKIARVEISGTSRFGLVADDEVALLCDDLVELSAVLDALRNGDLESAAAESIPLDEVRLLAPVTRPPQFLGVGLNYRDHALEAGSEIPEAPVTFGFLTSAICGPGDPIIVPPFASEVDWEAELGIVIGTAGRDIPIGSALDHVAGYTVVHDVSEREIQRSEGQWGRSKSFDTFKPIGPWIVTRDELGDASGLGIQLWLNEELKQSSSTSELIFSVPELVSRLSCSTTLQPGTVISTGTPAGVGFSRVPPEFLRPGDHVRIAIQGIGELSNPIAGDVQ